MTITAAPQIATCTIDVQQRILARYDAAVRVAQSAMETWKREPGNERAYSSMLVKLQHAHEEGISAKNSDPAELTAQLGSDAIESGIQAVLGSYLPPSTTGRAKAEEVATFVYTALVAFGFIGGIEATATSASSAISGRYLTQMPATKEQAMERAWTLLDGIVEDKVAEVIGAEEKIVISSRIIDAVLDTIAEYGAFVRLS